MSEYQYYEFRTADRLLTPREMGALRKMSTRAEIGPNSFTNFYTFGDFKGNPARMMEKYFDFFVYMANWWTHWCMIRVPRQWLDIKTAASYCPKENAKAWPKDEHVLLEFEAVEVEPEWDDDDGEAWMDALLPLREELARGDLRCLYLGWLACAQMEALKAKDLEPPVPPGLGSLSMALKAFAEFMRIDRALLAAAATRSPRMKAQPSSAKIKALVRCLPAKDKEELLVGLAGGNASIYREELLRYASRSEQGIRAGKVDGRERRTVAELFETASTHPRGRFQVVQGKQTAGPSWRSVPWS